MSIVGFEQAGASSAQGGQKLFLSFFQSYPLPLERDASPEGDLFGPAWRWWGDARIASYPQQISAPISQFLVDFEKQLAATPVNQLAQSGEFRMGVERRVAGFRQSFLPSPGVASEKTSLSAFGYFGALGSLSSPPETAQVFQIPPDGSPQKAAFDATFPVSKYPALALAATQYIGLTAPASDRFFRQYGAGFRLTTRFFDPTGRALHAPAMISASFGQNELVTGGSWRGVVGTFEAFYPLPLGTRTRQIATFYLFARTSLRLGGRPAFQTPLALSPASQVPVTNPYVALIALPSNRDQYTIGLGIDALQLILNIRASRVQ